MYGSLRPSEGGVARARVEAVETEDAGVHDVEKAKVVAADGQEGEVGGGVEVVDLARVGFVAGAEDILECGASAGEMLEGGLMRTDEGGEVAVDEFGISSEAAATGVFRTVKASTDTRRV